VVCDVPRLGGDDMATRAEPLDSSDRSPEGQPASRAASTGDPCDGAVAWRTLVAAFDETRRAANARAACEALVHLAWRESRADAVAWLVPSGHGNPAHVAYAAPIAPEQVASWSAGPTTLPAGSPPAVLPGALLAGADLATHVTVVVPVGLPDLPPGLLALQGPSTPDAIASLRRIASAVAAATVLALEGTDVDLPDVARDAEDAAALARLVRDAAHAPVALADLAANLVHAGSPVAVPSPSRRAIRSTSSPSRATPWRR
jgi:hypothetical protein